MDRRTFLGYAASLPVLAGHPDRLVCRGRRVIPSIDVLDDIDRTVTRLTDRYAATAPAVTGQTVRRQLPIVNALLADGDLPTPVDVRLHRAAGRLEALEGSALADTGRTAQAWTVLTTAHLHAGLARDRTAQAWVRMQQAVLAEAAGRPRDALVYAHDGQRTARRDSPVAARLAAEAEALAHADLGDLSAAHQALDRAWQIADALTDADHGRPGWHIDTLHPAELRSITAAVLQQAGDPNLALAYARSAVDDLDRASATGHRAYARINMANALLDTGQADHAAHQLDQALTVSDHRPTADLAACAGRTLAHLEQRTGPGATADLRQHLHAWRGV